MYNPNLDLNTEDKAAWADLGLSMETDFIARVVPKLGLDITMNPAKKQDKYAPDLVSSGKLADLKTQNTPFFTAGRYGKDPGRTVTFNRKDLERYQKLYPDLLVYFYVRWDQLEYHGRSKLSVAPLHGVWKAGVGHIDGLIKRKQAPEHEYRRRREDVMGNAKSSFLLSLDDLELVSLLDVPPLQETSGGGRPPR